MESPLPKIPACHKELSLYTPKDYRYSHTIYRRHTKRSSTVLTSHVTLFSLKHVCSCSFASSRLWHAQPLSAHPLHRSYSFLHLSCGYKLPRKAAPAARRQLKLRPCSPNGHGLGKRRYCGVGAFTADATTMSVRCGVGNRLT